MSIDIKFAVVVVSEKVNKDQKKKINIIVIK